MVEMAEMYSVTAFCGAYGISRSFLYNLWREGRGPAFVKVGKRRLISRPAAEAWRATLEVETEQQFRGAA
jgi:predicted DNA-binding transcriptional regulator AlpA